MDSKKIKIIKHKIPLKNPSTALLNEARKLAKVLQKKQKTIVLAESCTAGLTAATLSKVPGISKFFCGSMVTYQSEIKSRWLAISKIPPEKIVSADTAKKMINAVLKKTPEANIGASITGFLGPVPKNDAHTNIAMQQDGIVYIAVGMRSNKSKQVIVTIQEHHLLKNQKKSDQKLRHERQLLASHTMLFMVRSLLKK